MTAKNWAAQIGLDGERTKAGWEWKGCEARKGKRNSIDALCEILKDLSKMKSE